MLAEFLSPLRTPCATKELVFGKLNSPKVVRSVAGAVHHQILYQLLRRATSGNDSWGSAFVAKGSPCRFISKCRPGLMTRV